MEIINVQKEYAGQLKELFETSFGRNYMSLEKIESYIDGGTPFKLAVDGKELIGAVLFIPAREEDIKEHMKMDSGTVRRICRGKKALICKCACTNVKYQGNGYAKKILGACLKQVKEEGYGAVFTTLWKYKGGVPAEKMFKDYEFQKGEELEMPWYDDENYVCSECGGRCRCSGIVYYKVYSGMS